MFDTDNPNHPKRAAVPVPDFTAIIQVRRSKAPVVVAALLAIVASIVLLVVQAAA